MTDCKPSIIPLKTACAGLTLAMAVSFASIPTAGASAWEEAQLLLQEMTLEEKIQQLGNDPDAPMPSGTYISANNDFTVCEPSFVGRSIPGIDRVGIPTVREINGGNGIRGGSCSTEPVRTAGPSMTLAAASFDPELVEDWGEVVGNETFTMASQVLLGPGLNLIRTPYAGRAQEYPGEDPYLAGVIASAQIRGIQSQGVQAQPKHFVGNEHEFQRERWTAAVRIPSRAMHELYLLPFEMAVRDAQAATIMCAFPHLNFDYVCDSQGALVKTLRERWGFDGWIESDRRAMHSTVDAMLAGVGWELDFRAKFYAEEPVMEALDAGLITETDIDAVLLPRYAKMFEFGQFDNPFDTIIRPDEATWVDNAAKARRLAEAGITLLKNDIGLLPLGPDVQNVALIGHRWFAGSATIPPRNGDPRELTTVVPWTTVSPQQGLEDYGLNVTYVEGTDVDEALDAAAAADVVLLLVGTTPRETRDLLSLRLPAVCIYDDSDDYEEACISEDDVYCPPSEPGLSENCVFQDELVTAIAAEHGNKTTVVLYSGAGILMDPWLDNISALIAAWFPGQEEGAVLADILFGTINPSGKLPVTFPVSDREAAFATESQYPGDREDTGLPGGPGFPGIDVDDWDDLLGNEQLISRYLEELEMGYRWYEANGVTPVFPFGYGLSYTRFEYSNLRLHKQFRKEWADIQRPGSGNAPLRNGYKLVAQLPVLTVEFDLTNTGFYAGAEAAQVYLQLPWQAQQPAKRLVGFDKVHLQPGETRRVSITIDAGASNHPFSYFVPDYPDDLAAWADGEWASQSGQYTVYVGGSSADTPLIDRIGIAFPQVGKRADASVDDRVNEPVQVSSRNPGRKPR